MSSSATVQRLCNTEPASVARPLERLNIRLPLVIGSYSRTVTEAVNARPECGSFLCALSRGASGSASRLLSSADGDLLCHWVKSNEVIKARLPLLVHNL